MGGDALTGWRETPTDTASYSKIPSLLLDRQNSLYETPILFETQHSLKLQPIFISVSDYHILTVAPKDMRLVPNAIFHAMANRVVKSILCRQLYGFICGKPRE